MLTGYVKIPAPPSEECPKCHASNTDKQFYIWRVADRQGPHGECDVCAHVWRLNHEGAAR